jgi:1-acyl-sn-glycerol-3-phosphate acyltransferase
MKESKFLTRLVLPFLNYTFGSFIDIIGNENFYKFFRRGAIFYYKISDYNLKVYDNNVKNSKKPLLIVANHDDMFSGLYMVCSLNERMYPMLSMLAEPSWMKEPLKGILLRYVFIIENNDPRTSIRGLNDAVKCLQKGEDVLIFANGPGSIGNYFTRDCPYKKGAAYIARQAKRREIDFYVIPTFIRTGEHLDSRTGIGSDKNVTICFGNPLDIDPNSRLGEITEEFKRGIGLLEKRVLS